MTTDLQDRLIANQIAARLDPNHPYMYGPTCCAHREGITGYGRRDADVMIVGIAPDRSEMREGRPFVGPSGKLLDAALKACNYDREKIYATNLCCFWKDEPTPAEIEGCSDRLLHEIQLVSPKLIVTCGALATERLTGRKVGKARGAIIPWDQNISDWKKFQIELSLVSGVTGQAPTILPTWHPAAILRVPSMGNDMVRDFLKIPRFLAHELDQPNITTDTVVDDPQQAQAIFDNLRGHIVAADVETADDSEDAMSQVICMAVAVRTKYAPDYIQTRVFTKRALAGLTNWHIDEIHWVFHNGQFDTQAIYRTFGVWLPIKDDTMLISYNCDERPGYNEGKDKKGAAHGPGFHGLKQLAREYCSAGWYEVEVKGTLGKSLEEIAEPQQIIAEAIGDDEQTEGQPSRSKKAKPTLCWETPAEAKQRYETWLSDFYLYNAYDAAYTLCLLSRLPTDRDERNYRDVLLPAANAYARMQYHGINVDEARLDALIQEFTPKIEVARLDLQAQAHELGYRNEPKLKRDQKARDEYEQGTGIIGSWPGYEPLNLGSNKQMGEFLFQNLKLRPLMFTKKGGKPSTSAEHLLQLNHPFCRAVGAQNQREHIFGTYYLGAKQHIRGDGRFHSYPWLHGTTTGRRSYTEPAMQTFPQPYTFEDFPENREFSKIREIIVPSSPDMVLIEADYEQIEVWIGALLAHDQMMLADLQQPYYATTGDTKPNYHSRVARDILLCDAPDDSDEFKAARQLAKTTTFSLMYLVEADHFASIIKRPKPEAKRILNNWYKRYRDFGDWQKSVLRDMRTKGEVTTPFGYRRRFPIVLDNSADKVAVNHPIQSTGGTLSLLSIIELGDTLPSIGGQALLDVHDSTLSEAPRGRVREACQLIRQAMTNPRIQGWPQLRVEIKIGNSWGSMMSEEKWLAQNGVPA